MLREEFTALTGIHPTSALYAQIEKRYMDSDLDKVEFCKAFKKDLNGMATGAQRDADIATWMAEDKARTEIAALEEKIAKLEAQLEAEQEWQVKGVESGMSEEDYSSLASENVGSRFLSDTEARDKISDEFGFAHGRIKILHEVPIEEVNRHHMVRTTKTAKRMPVYNATDWNYIRFDCAGWSYEMINGNLNKI